MTLASILSIAGGLTTTSVFAAEYNDPELLPAGSTIDDMFFDQIDDDRVLPMPNGGFLHGEIIEVDAENSDKVIGIYNSSLDPNSVTVEEAKKKAVENAKKVLDEQIKDKENIVNTYINYDQTEEIVEAQVIYEVLEEIGTKEKIVF